MDGNKNDEEYAMSIEVHDGIGPIEESLSQEESDSQMHQVQNLVPTPPPLPNTTQANIIQNTMLQV